MERGIWAIALSIVILLSTAGANIFEAQGETTIEDDTDAYLAVKEDAVLTVDDEGDGDYTSIAEAVATANPGDTIEVYSGDYYECNITIYASGLTLKGMARELGSGTDTGKPSVHGGRK